MAVPQGAQASHQPPVPSGIGAIEVYVETIPTSSGPRTTEQVLSEPPTPLPEPVSRKLKAEGDDDARTLERIATTGPPPRRPDAPLEGPATPDADLAADSSFVSALGAAARGSGSGRLTVLLGILGAVSAALLSVAVVRRRS